MQPLNFDTPVIDELGKVHPLKEYAGGGGGGDISDAIPVFTTDDTIQNPTEKVSMPLFQSGNALKDLLRWISKAMQNIRYLLKFTEDISTDLNTTIEQVEDINTNLVKEWTDTSVAFAKEYYWYNNLIWKALVDTANTPAEGSEWHNVKVMDEVSELNSNIMKIGGTDFSNLLHNFQANETYTTDRPCVLYGTIWIYGGSPSMTIDGVDVLSAYITIMTVIDKPFNICIPIGKKSVIRTGSAGTYPKLYGMK